jgi:hypothetical protein
VDKAYSVVLLHEQDGRYSAVVPALECATWGHTGNRSPADLDALAYRVTLPQ